MHPLVGSLFNSLSRRLGFVAAVFVFTLPLQALAEAFGWFLSHRLIGASANLDAIWKVASPVSVLAAGAAILCAILATGRLGWLPVIGRTAALNGWLPGQSERLDDANLRTLRADLGAFPRRYSGFLIAFSAAASVLFLGAAATLGVPAVTLWKYGAGCLAATSLAGLYAKVLAEFATDAPILEVRREALRRNLPEVSTEVQPVAQRFSAMLLMYALQFAAVLASSYPVSAMRLGWAVTCVAVALVPVGLVWATLWRNTNRLVGGARRYLETGDPGHVATSFRETENADLAVALQSAVSKALETHKELEALVHSRTSELQTALDELRLQDVQRRDFLAVASHELRTPLTAIIGYLKLMITGEITTSEGHYRTAIITMAANSQRLLNYVNNLLDAVRIESGNFTLEMQRVSIHDAWDRVLRDLRPLVEHQQIQVDADISKDAYVAADRQALEQVLINLLTNAIKHAPRGSRVHIATEPDGDRWKVTVRDHGSGIAPDVLSKLFQPFGKGGVPHEALQRGTGLGLLISRTLVQAMEGELTGRNHSDGGAEFSFVMKAQAQEKTGAPSHPHVKFELAHS